MEIKASRPVSDESFDFTPGPEPKFPKLIMRAFTSQDQYVEWIFTPPNDAGWFHYKFEAKQENEVLFVNFDQSIMTPRTPE
jgi:hypothetical protein